MAITLLPPQVPRSSTLSTPDFPTVTTTPAPQPMSPRTTPGYSLQDTYEPPVLVAGAGGGVRALRKLLGETFDNATARIQRGLTPHIDEAHVAGKVGKSLFTDASTAQNAILDTLASGRQLIDDLTPTEAGKLAKDGRVVRGDLRIYNSADKNGVSTVIEKKFADPVGTQGEKVVRVVTDLGVKGIVTAFPVFAFAKMTQAQNTQVTDSFQSSVRSAITEINRIPKSGDRHGWVADLAGVLDPTGIFGADATVSEAQERRGLLMSRAVSDAERAAGRAFSPAERRTFEERWTAAVLMGIR